MAAAGAPAPKKLRRLNLSLPSPAEVLHDLRPGMGSINQTTIRYYLVTFIMNGSMVFSFIQKERAKSSYPKFSIWSVHVRLVGYCLPRQDDTHPKPISVHK